MTLEDVDQLSCAQKLWLFVVTKGDDKLSIYIRAF